MFLSQRPNNDPEPWQSVFADHVRSSTNNAWDRAYKPRPEFTQTRDPHPYVGPNGATRHAFPGWLGSDRLVWSPRHEEFDTPVNPILAEFRRNGGNAVLYISLDRWPTPEEIKFAQRVLKLRATLSN